MSEVVYGVTGATGQLGQLVINELLAKVDPQNIVAIVRDITKAEGLQKKGVQVRIASYQDNDALIEAISGVHKLLLISSSDMSSSRAEQHKNVIDAAKARGVQYIAYTSILEADTTTNPLAPDHKATEEYILASGLSYSFLRHGWYHENYTGTIASADQSGIVLTSAGEGRVSSAARGDYAAADVAVLTHDSPERVYELAGDDSWNFAELAAIVAGILGKEVVLRSVDYSEHVAQLITAGLDAGTAQFVAAIDTSIADGGLQNDDKMLSRVIERPTVTLEAGLRAGL